MHRKLIFLHLPKTGGTSLTSMLSNHFDAAQVCPKRVNDLMTLEDGDLSKYQFFSGHYKLAEIPAALRDQDIVSIFRNPRDRLLSTYYYHRSLSWDFIEERGLERAKRAKENDLLTWLREIQDDDNLCNTMARAIVVPPSGATYEDMSDSEKVENAFDKVDKLSAIGIFEYYDVSAALIFQSLGLEHPDRLKHLQVNPSTKKAGKIASGAEASATKRYEITEDIEAELNRLTKLDHQLYDYAKKQFFVRLSEDALKLVQAISKKQEETANERDIAVAQRNKAAAERNKATAERDQAKAERDKAAAERDRVTAERDHAKRYPWKNLSHAAKLRLKRLS